MLTPALILSLRASIRWRVNSPSVRPEPHILYLPAEGAFCVWADSRPMCATGDPALACWLLRAERAQPGFIAGIMDTSIDPETACLDPVARAQRLAEQREVAARLRAMQLESEAARKEAARRLASGIASSDPRSLAYKPPINEVDFDTL